MFKYCEQIEGKNLEANIYLVLNWFLKR